MRQLRAFAFLRWRLLLNGVRGSSRRDTVEQVSRILAVAAPVAIVVFSLGSVLALSVGGFLAGETLARNAPASEVAVLVIRIVLAVQLMVVVFMPLGVGSQSGAKYARLLLRPTHRRVLHLVEVASGVADPWIFVVLPGLGLLVIGLLVGGDVSAVVIMTMAGLGLAAGLLSLSALVSFVAAWLMRDRRRAEWLTLACVLVLSLAALLPQALSLDAARERRDASAAGEVRPSMTVARVETWLPAWTQALPSEMYGRALQASTRTHQSGTAAAWTAGIWVQAVFVYLLSGVVYRRLLDAGEGQARRRGAVRGIGLPRLPWVGSVVSAVAMAQYRTALRSVRGRLAVLLPGPMTALVALVLHRAPEEAAWIAEIPRNGHLVFGAGLIFAIYALQAFTMNQFASDRAGLTLQFLLPISARALVAGKAIGTFALFCVGSGLTLVATLLSTGGSAVMLWVAAAVGGAAVFISLAPLATVMSALLPVKADMSKTGSGGNPHGAAMLVSTIAVLVASVPPGLIVLLGPRTGDWMTLGASVVWLLLVVTVAWPLLVLGARTTNARRENLYLTK